MDNSINSTIESASSVLILLPQNPDFDNVAAGLGLYLAIRDKKEASISCPTQMRVEFNRLVGVNKITSELGNKNMVMRFINYKATDIERVSYDIENSQFKLTIIPKPQAIPPTKDQVDFSMSGVSADLVIMIAGTSETDFPALGDENLAGVKVVHVGINSLSGKSDAISFAKPASSVSEVVAGVIKEVGSEYDSDIATNLIMGIDEGSKQYASPGVTADTFQLVADLMRAGGRRIPKDQVRAQAYPPGAIPGRPVQRGRAQQSRSKDLLQDDQQEEPPNDWKEPKIYKGTSVS